MQDTSPLKHVAESVTGAVDLVSQHIQSVKQAISQVIFGQQQVVEESIITILSGGHLLLVGLPGLAKTKLVETLGKVMGLEEKRVQCTPDLMPADILGSEILDQTMDGKKSFRFVPGPVFTQLFMADEINRASPRTQSALLQAMQEKRVSVAGLYHDLPKPFHVLATQNPIEQEGTYPLPEAQLDRFLMQVNIGYPDRVAEKQMLVATTGITESVPQKVLNPQTLMNAQALVRQIPVGDQLVDIILNIIRNGRPDSTSITEVKKYVAWGPGPRASQALMLACRARALLEGRYVPNRDDVVQLATPVLRHRMALNFNARSDGINLDKIIEILCQRAQN